jgi:hypothetical protein
MSEKEIIWEEADWIQISEDREKYLAILKKVMQVVFPQNEENILDWRKNC